MVELSLTLPSAKGMIFIETLVFLGVPHTNRNSCAVIVGVLITLAKSWLVTKSPIIQWSDEATIGVIETFLTCEKYVLMRLLTYITLITASFS